MTNSHLVSVVDEDGLREYYAYDDNYDPTAAPVDSRQNEEYLEDEVPPDDTKGWILFAMLLGGLACALWFGAILVLLLRWRRRNRQAEMERILTETRQRKRDTERRDKVTAFILTRKITNIKEGRIELAGFTSLSQEQLVEATCSGAVRKGNYFVIDDDDDDYHYESNVMVNDYSGTVSDNNDKDSNNQNGNESCAVVPTAPASNGIGTNEDEPDTVTMETNTVPTDPATKEEYLLDCPICLNPFQLGEELAWSRDLKCNHVFHSECLGTWLMKQDECPCCRLVLVDNGEGVVGKEGPVDEEGSTSVSASVSPDDCDDDDDEKDDSVTAASTVDVTNTNEEDENEETNQHDYSYGNFYVVDGLVSFAGNNRCTPCSSSSSSFENKVTDTAAGVTITYGGDTETRTCSPERWRAQQNHTHATGGGGGDSSNEEIKSKGWRVGRTERKRRKAYTVVQSTDVDDENDEKEGFMV